MGKRILGIHTDFHESGAVVCDSAPVSAVSEERYTRKKMDGSFPHHSIAHALSLAHLNAKDLDAIAFSGAAPGLKKLFLFFFDQVSRVIYTRGGNLIPNLRPGSFHPRRLLQQLGVFSIGEAWEIGREVTKTIAAFRRKGFTGKVFFFDHDYCHAAGAYYSSGYKNCLVAIIEGSSFRNTASFWKGENGTLTKIHHLPLPHSMGRFYELPTLLLGFNPKRHAGKITGLAAYGDPSVLYETVADLLSIDGIDVRVSKRLFVLYEEYLATRKIPEPFKNHTKEDIAAAFQKRLEDVVTVLLGRLLEKHGGDTVILSGGVASNVKMNMEVMHARGVRRVSVHPAMSDVGQGLGAALAAEKKLDPSFMPFRLSDVYLGDSFSEGDIECALRKWGVRYSRPAEYAFSVAQLLAKTKTVGLFQGRMEFGPRALGNRSILYAASDKSVNDWLNKQLHRTEFMPFAPVTLETHAADCYDRFDLERGGDSLRYMTMAVRTTDFMKEKMGAAVHVDGTARPQLIDAETNPLYHSILSHYCAETGLPTLVNTSFNMHEEPIICTPDEAIRAFRESNLDALAIAPFLALREQQEYGA